MRISALATCLLTTLSAWAVNVADYPDLQAALDAHPGKVLTLPAGDYPISRPLYVYVSKKALARPEVKAFVNDYVDNAVQLATDAQFVPAPQSSLDADKKTLSGS